MPAEALPNWQVAAESVRGASHVQSGAPNQDSVGTLRLANDRGVILAVADGHGDARHPRSDRGSRFAVQAATETVSAWLSDEREGGDERIRRSAAQLPRRIVEAWLAKVRHDVQVDPPRDWDGRDGAGPELLYGSTLVVAAVDDRLCIFLQVGDGDILTIDRNNKVARRARGRLDIPAHMTESLCQMDAIERFRTELVFQHEAAAPPLLFLSTDGYANSFVDEKSFLKVAPDLRSILEQRGIDHVREKLARWLDETSQSGSGDDISLALLWNSSAAAIAVPGARRKRKAVIRAAISIAVLALLIALGTWAWFPSTWARINPTHWPQVIAALVQSIQKPAPPQDGPPGQAPEAGASDVRPAPGADDVRPVPGADDVRPAPAEVPPLP